MKKALFSSLLAITLIVSMSISALAVSSADLIVLQSQEQPRIQITQQYRVQTNISEAERELSRLQLREKMQVTDQARTQQQDRLRLQEQSQILFSDIEQHWATEQIRSAYSWGLTNGYPDGRYNPNGNISGTQGVLMMSRLMNCLDAELSGNGTVDDIDWDLVPLWAREQMREAAALRIATQSQFYGLEQLNRLQFIVMLANAMGVDPAEVTDETVVFLDQDSIPASDLGYIHALRMLGIVVGNDGYFYPDQAVTRAEAATMLSRILEILE